ncbi:MAG: gliding motility-associated C-terminal domain-containing protein [Bacteroidetes bacterium]|nr:gliding motility-associated C-terminal domain-containing protein [Bacteroidota bacterium]
MKLKLYFLAIVFLVCNISNLRSQTYILTPPGGSVFTTCKGFVENDLCCYDPPFCTVVYYCQGDNHFNTFQSGTPGMPIRMNFTFLDLNTGDFVRVYQGLGTGGPLLATFTNTYTTLGTAVTSTTGVITIRFTTNSDNNVGTGYTAILGCPPVGCGINLPAGDDCSSTTRICDTQPYCGNTGGWFTADHENIAATNAEANNIPNTFATNNTFCGSIENNSWLVFTANTPSPTFSVNVGNCASSATGIQMLMLASTNCNTFSAVSSCISQSAAATSFTVGATTLLTPGTDYYIMIDGYAGNYCDYTVTPLAGVQIATLNAGVGALCQNQTTILTTSNTVGGSTFVWAASTSGAIGGSTTSLSITATPTVVGTTIYTVTITQPNGCAVQSYTRSIILNALPVANAGTIPASITCANPTQALSGSGGVTYVWSGTGIVSGGATANPVINQAGPFSLTVTSGAGCTSTNVATVSVPVNTTQPSPAVTSPTVLNCSNPTMNLNATPGSGVTYAWTGPGIVSGGATSTPLINAGGTYSVTMTATVNGCSNGTSIVIAAINNSIIVTPSTTGSVTCSNMFISLNTPAVGGQTYTWTAPAGAAITAGVNSAAATGSNSGTYSVTVFNTINGCSSTSVIAAVVNTVQGVPNATSTGTVTCASNAVNLNSATAGVTYTWVAPAGSSISSGGNTNSASGSGGGTYTLNVTNTTNGCPNTNVVTVTTQTVKPIAVINTTPVITCNNPTVNITGGPAAGVTYTWSGGTIVGSPNNNNANVSSTAVYSLAVTSTSNGCTSASAATVNITSNLVTPTLSAPSQTANLVCGATSVALTGNSNPGGSTYTWTSSGGGFASGVNASTVAVTTATTYVLISAHPVTGCTTSLTYTVIPDVNSPTVSLSSPSGTVTCATTILSTTATSNPAAGVTYAWSGPGIVGATNAAAVSGSLSGTYNLTVTNTSNNCKSTVSYNLFANNTAITPNAVASNTVNCIATTVTISTAPTPTSGAFTYSWSTGATTSSIAVTPTATTNYTVTVTNPSNGCTGTAVIQATANTAAPTAVSISPNNVLLACPAQTAFITGSAVGAVSYSWVAPAGGSIISGATTATAQVTSSSIGTFSLIATGSNGCSAAAATATVSPNTNAPTFTLSNANPSITCLTSSPNVTVGLTSTVSIQSYSWSPSLGISGPTNTSVVTFTAAGTYTGMITATNGCISTTTISVSNATIAPSMVAGTGTAQSISCSNTVVTIAPSFTPAANLTYTWSGPGIVGSPNNANVQVNQNGSYSLTVTNTLTGCSSTSITVPVVGTNVPPTLNVSISSSIGIGCQPNTSTVNLTASSSGAVTYSWSNGATTAMINTANAGTYTCTVTDSNSGCTATQTIAVANNTTAPSFTAAASGNLPCGGSGTTTLNATSSNTNAIYNWSGPAITSGSNTANAQVSAAGVYTVLVTDNVTGCSSTQTVGVNSTSVLAAFNPDVITGLAPLTVNFSNQSTGATTYSWSFGNGTSTQTNPSNTFPTGTYTVVLTSMNGACTSTAEVVIKVNNKIGNVPEVFTPNSDGHNDVFEITGLDSYPNNSLQIFNRWGNQVYFAKPYKNDWDGSPNANGKTGSNKLPTGTYFYILDLGDDDKTIIRGFIQLQY